MEPNTSGEIRVITRAHPFSEARIETNRPAGGTVVELMQSVDVPPDRIFARVFIDDRLVPSAEWEQTRPTAGQLVTIRVIPTDSGGGGSKDALRLVAMIAVVAAAAWVSGGAGGLMTGAFAGGTAGAAGAGAVVGIGLSLAMNGHIPALLPRRAMPQPIPARALEDAA